MGYRELSVYLWYTLDKLREEGRIADGMSFLDVGGVMDNYRWFFKDLNVGRYDIVNLYTHREGYSPSKPCRFFSIDAHDMRELPDESYDFGLSVETPEHLYDPIRAVDEMRRLLKPEGIIFLSAMCGYGYHPDPRCYWNVYPDGMEYMLRGFDIVEMVGYGGNAKTPMGVWALAVKRQNPKKLEMSEIPMEDGWKDEAYKLSHLSEFYIYIQDGKSLKAFMEERGYVYELGKERLRTIDGRTVGESPDLRTREKRAERRFHQFHQTRE